MALRLAGALRWFWWRHGYYAEGARWLEEARARAPQWQEPYATGANVRIRTLLSAAELVAHPGDIERACTCLEETLSLARTDHDPACINQALASAPVGAVFARHTQDPFALLHVTVDRARGLGQPQRLDMALFFLGRTEQTHASVAESAAHLTEAVRLLEATGDRCVVGAIHLDLGIIAGAVRPASGGDTSPGRIGSQWQSARWLLNNVADGVLALVGNHTDWVNSVALVRLLGEGPLAPSG